MNNAGLLIYIASNLQNQTQPHLFCKRTITGRLQLLSKQVNLLLWIGHDASGVRTVLFDLVHS